MLPGSAEDTRMRNGNMAIIAADAGSNNRYAIPSVVEGSSIELSVKPSRLAVTLVSNIVYAQVEAFCYPNVPLRMDALRPEIRGPLPAVVFVAGGGFISANKDAYLQQRLQIAESGYAVFGIEYRYAAGATFPSPLEDVKAAIRYLRAHADKLGVDSKRIAVMGESAGGYLAALAGTSNGRKEFDRGDCLDQSSDVQAVVDLYGLSDLSRIGDGFPLEARALHDSPASPEALWVNGPALFGLGGAVKDRPEKAAAANPMSYISARTAPFLLMHGDRDMLVSPDQTRILHEALIAKGIESTRYVVKGAGHAGDYWLQPEVIEVIMNYLDRHLK